MLTLNGLPIEVTRFSDQTSQVWKLPFVVGPTAHIQWKFTQEAELIHLAQLVDLLRSMQVRTIHLEMDYLPYARQDKEITNESTFALRTFANFLNSLKLDKISAIDSHSDEPLFLIKNFHNIFPATHIAKAVKACDPDVLCYPDKGARIRYAKNLTFLNRSTAHGEKQRDQLTGHITSYTLHGDVFDKDVLIVDDICDGGMTFILMAKELLKAHAKSVNLYTTHGIYSRGLKPLKEAQIKGIYTKDGQISEFQDNILIKGYDNE